MGTVETTPKLCAGAYRLDGSGSEPVYVGEFVEIADSWRWTWTVPTGVSPNQIEDHWRQRLTSSTVIDPHGNPVAGPELLAEIDQTAIVAVFQNGYSTMISIRRPEPAKPAQDARPRQRREPRIDPHETLLTDSLTVLAAALFTGLFAYQQRVGWAFFFAFVTVGFSVLLFAKWKEELQGTSTSGTRLRDLARWSVGWATPSSSKNDARKYLSAVIAQTDSSDPDSLLPSELKPPEY